MNVLLPVRTPFTNHIFSGIKPVEFRNRIPKNLKPGDKIYVYESKFKGGIGKVLGHVTVKAIHEIDQKIRYGTYILSEFYLPLLGSDEEKRLFEKVKLAQFEDVKKGFAIHSIIEEARLDFYIKNKRQMTMDEISKYVNTSKNIDDMDKSNEYCEKVDKWGRKIGFYDDNDKSHWKYAIELENPVKFNIKKDLVQFRKLDGTIIKKAPQSFCYIKEVDDFLYLKTYQSKIAAIILETEDYFASMKNAKFPKEYCFLKNLLKIKGNPQFECPIFCCYEKLNDCNYLGYANNECLIHLKVPVSECIMMEFYDWVDVMSSIQDNDDYLVPCSNMLVNEVSNQMDVHSYEKLQVVLTRIKKEWIQSIEYKKEK